MMESLNTVIDRICIKYGVLNKTCEWSINTLQGALSDAVADRLKELEAENAQLRQEREEAVEQLKASQIQWSNCLDSKTEALRIAEKDRYELRVEIDRLNNNYNVKKRELTAALKRAKEAEKKLSTVSFIERRATEIIRKEYLGIEMNSHAVDAAIIIGERYKKLESDNAALRQQLEEARKTIKELNFYWDKARSEIKTLNERSVHWEILENDHEKLVTKLRSKLSTLEAELARGRKGGTYSGHL
jgi:chromosome segregation ATPase